MTERNPGSSVRRGGRRRREARDPRPDWPNRSRSRFVAAGGLRWHVQVAGSGPVLLLVHGTGAATHSWRDLLPLLARHFTVVAPDLPGHGFTERPRAEGLSLPAMARGVTALLRVLGLQPGFAAGHSAGAAVIARMTPRWRHAPRALVGLNAALLPFEGLAGQIFSPIARLLSGVPVVPWFFAWRAGDRGLVERLLRDTGSTPRCARRRALRPAGAAARACRRGARHDGALGVAAAAARPDEAGRAAGPGGGRA